MKGTESKKSHYWGRNSHISHTNSSWLAENLDKMDQNVKRMFKLIVEDGNACAKEAEMCCPKRPELIACVEVSYHIYQSLAERYNHLTGESHENTSSEHQMQSSGISDSGSGHASPLQTPIQNLGLLKNVHHNVGLDLFLSSGGGSSDLSLKEGSESSSLSSSDSDSESESVNAINSSGFHDEGKGLFQNIVGAGVEFAGMKEKSDVAEEENIDLMLKERENSDYEELLGRIIKNEDELRVSNQKLKFSEEEISRLKSKLTESESITVLAENLQAQVESSQNAIKMRENDLEMERKKALALEKQIAELQTQCSESNWKIQALMSEIEMNKEKLQNSNKEIERLEHEFTNEVSEGALQLQGQLDLAWNNIARLEAELDLERMKTSELQNRIVRYIADVSDRDEEVRELEVALHDAQEKFSLEKAVLRSNNLSLVEQHGLLELRLELLESEIKQYKAENTEMKCLYEAKEIGLQGQIEGLREEHVARGEVVDALNKSFDMLKLKYDMLVAEKDGVYAKVRNLIAEVSSQDIEIQRMQVERARLSAESESERKVVDGMRYRVEELEKEVDRQRGVISDGAEQKREAIRQLCFSLEHYRSGYIQLREAFTEHKRCAVVG